MNNRGSALPSLACFGAGKWEKRREQRDGRGRWRGENGGRRDLIKLVCINKFILTQKHSICVIYLSVLYGEIDNIERFGMCDIKDRRKRETTNLI